MYMITLLYIRQSHRTWSSHPAYSGWWCRRAQRARGTSPAPTRGPPPSHWSSVPGRRRAPGTPAHKRQYTHRNMHVHHTHIYVMYLYIYTAALHIKHWPISYIPQEKWPDGLPAVCLFFYMDMDTHSGAHCIFLRCQFLSGAQPNHWQN